MKAKGGGEDDGSPENGNYWSSSLGSWDNYNAQTLYFSGGNTLFVNDIVRCTGRPIRALTTTQPSNEKILNFATKKSIDELNDRVKILEEKEDYYNNSELRGRVENLENDLYEVSESTVKYVDLGLPSGLLWATCNLGAETETDYGLYFQWGDVKGYKKGCSKAESDGNDDAHYFYWGKYKYCDGTYDTLTKYCTQSSYGTVDNKRVLDPEDDAATAMLGGLWRIPTYNDLIELKINTIPGDGANEYGWIEDYNGTGVNGVLLKSKTNGNTIFFPAGGYIDSSSARNVGKFGYYYSSCLDDYPNSSYCTTLLFSFDRLNSLNEQRCFGRSVRAVTTTTAVKTIKFTTKEEVKTDIDNVTNYVDTEMAKKPNIVVCDNQYEFDNILTKDNNTVYLIKGDQDVWAAKEYVDELFDLIVELQNRIKQLGVVHEITSDELE